MKMDEGPILDGKGRFRHWMENFSDKDFLDECSKERLKRLYRGLLWRI